MVDGRPSGVVVERSRSRIAAGWYGSPWCSAVYLGETTTGSPVATASSISWWAMPLAWMLISSRRPVRTMPSKTVRQKSWLPSGIPLSTCARKVTPLISGQASSSMWSASRQ
jgi:hypothetical protein